MQEKEHIPEQPTTPTNPEREFGALGDSTPLVEEKTYVVPPVDDSFLQPRTPEEEKWQKLFSQIDGLDKSDKPVESLLLVNFNSEVKSLAKNISDNLEVLEVYAYSKGKAGLIRNVDNITRLVNLCKSETALPQKEMRSKLLALKKELARTPKLLAKSLRYSYAELANPALNGKENIFITPLTVLGEGYEKLKCELGDERGYSLAPSARMKQHIAIGTTIGISLLSMVTLIIYLSGGASSAVLGNFIGNLLSVVYLSARHFRKKGDYATYTELEAFGGEKKSLFPSPYEKILVKNKEIRREDEALAVRAKSDSNILQNLQNLREVDPVWMNGGLRSSRDETLRDTINSMIKMYKQDEDEALAKMPGSLEKNREKYRQDMCDDMIRHPNKIVTSAQYQTLINMMLTREEDLRKLAGQPPLEVVEYDGKPREAAEPVVEIKKSQAPQPKTNTILWTVRITGTENKTNPDHKPRPPKPSSRSTKAEKAYKDETLEEFKKTIGEIKAMQEQLKREIGGGRS